MSEEQKEQNPKYKPSKNVDVGEPAQIKLLNATPIEGESKYGKWWMWTIEVDNAKVTIGKGLDERSQSGYSGKAIMFATSEKMNNEFLKMTGGVEEGVVVELDKENFESQGERRQKYIYKKISGGTASPSSFSPTELSIIEMVRAFKEEGTEVTEENFINITEEQSYAGLITKERAKELYKYI